MLLTFRSKAAPNLIMLDDLATRLLETIGRKLEPRGILTVEQLPAAIQHLENAIAQETAHKIAAPTASHSVEEDEADTLGLRQRAFPFLSMLRQALEKKEPVLWE